MSDFAYHKHSLHPGAVGITLIELLVSITVIAILLALTLPSFKNALLNNRLLAEADALTNSLNYARSTALSQTINVIACPANTPGSTTCGTNWQTGWIIVSQPTTGAAVLLQSTFSGTNDPVLSATATSITFDPRGLATTQANFKLCDNRGGAFARSVEVLPTGFVQTGSTMGVAVWNGGALTCP